MDLYIDRPENITQQAKDYNHYFCKWNKMHFWKEFKKNHSKIDSKSDSRLHSMFYNMPKKRSIKYLACMISDIYSETCLKRTLDKPKSCINRTCNKVLMQEIFVNLTCINQIPVYSEHKSWSQWGSGYMLCCV